MADGISSIAGSTARSASYNVILQVSFRILTFLMNGVLLRYTSKDMLGIVNVRLMLLVQTIVFVTREAFRKACLSKTTDRNWHQIINLLWCVFPLGVVTALCLSHIWLNYVEQPDPDKVANYPFAVIVFASSACIELLCEQLWVIGQVFLFLKLKVIVEGAANFVRCFVTVFLVIVFPGMGIIAFCWAQVAFSLVIVVFYYSFFIYSVKTSAVKKNETLKDFPLKSVRDFFPKVTFNESFISWQLANLTWSFFKQSFLKKILTEGERFIMTILQVLTFAEQGIYDVINNLGSLAARSVFMPIEESYYTFFAHTLVRGQVAKQQTPDAAKMASEALEMVLKFVVLTGLTILTFGYAYSFLLLDIYGGSLLSSGEGPTLLKWYCVYVLIIAINGTTECFMFAAMSKEEVDRYNYKMMLFSVVFLVASWYLTILGSVGFVIANCLNMLLRIFQSVVFIHKYFESTPDMKPLRGIIPSFWVAVAYGVSWVITFTSERTFCCNRGWLYRLVHIGVGAVCLLSVAFVVFVKETRFVDFMAEHWLGKARKKKE